jgi:GAF domain-containing protein
MQDEPQAEEQDALAEARKTIARQTEELERLRGQLAADQFGKELRDAFSLAVTTGTIAAPVVHSRLLETIVEMAAHVISARAASLYFVDEASQELVVEHSLGPKAEEVKEIRVPLGQGIVGVVAATGQPMAVWDAQSDPRHAADIAERLGYLPKSILGVPLLYSDQVIGVLELFDKEGGSKFNSMDLETLELFANQAAIAIEQSRTLQNLTLLISHVLRSVGQVPDEQARKLREGARGFAQHLEENPAYSQALELARLTQEIAQHGPSEQGLCQTMLRGFAEYLRSRPQPIGDLWTVDDLARANEILGLHH